MNDYEVTTNFNFSFMKVDPSYKVLKGEEYELVSLDGKYSTGLYTKEEEYGDYHFEHQEYFDSGHERYIYPLPSEEAIKLIPKPILDEIYKIETIDDLEAMRNANNSLFPFNNYGGSKYYEGKTRIPLRFRNTKTLLGYKKTDFVVLGDLVVDYFYDNANNIIKKRIDIRSFGVSDVIYNREFPTINSLDDIALYLEQYDKLTCMNTDDQEIIIMDPSAEVCHKTIDTMSGSYIYVPYFVAEKGTINFKIENTVNGLAKYNASKGKNLKYEVRIKNIGNSPSSGNVLVSNVPKKIIVDEDKISNGGIYNKNDSTITWNFDLIAEGEELTVSYEASVPSDVKGEDLVGNSSINSDQLEKAIYSADTIVTLDKMVEIIKEITNPETTTMVYIPNTSIVLPLNIVLIAITIVCIITFTLKIIFKRKNKKYQEVK